ncbi:MAG: hypothetical protein ACTSSP_08175 [Candidatus Asgardarchaeia archaeon]
MQKLRVKGVALLLILYILVLGFSGYVVDSNYSDMTFANASKYSPIIFTEPGDKPIKISYLYKDKDNMLTYYIFWKDEYHPDHVIDSLYRFFRTFYFGSSVDIERIKIRFYENNTPELLIFETVNHEVVELLIINKTYAQFKNGSIVKCLRDYHPILYIVTWNHMFGLKPISGKSYIENNFTNIEKLTLEEYVAFKMFRRSRISLQFLMDLLSLFLLPVVLLVTFENIKRCLK